MAIDLDRLEAEALHLARSEAPVADWRSLLQAIDESNATSPPRLDPDEARQSCAELRLLLSAMSPLLKQRATPQRQRPLRASATIAKGQVDKVPTRGGYRIASESRDKEAKVWPAFAEALQQGARPTELVSDFGDLWSIDLSLWELIPTGSPAELAETWLTSPGRRLLADLRPLTAPPAQGAANFSIERIYAAAGVREIPSTEGGLTKWWDEGGAQTWLNGRPTDWRRLHSAVPGELIRFWTSTDSDLEAVDALRMLEPDWSPSRRGAALAWVLDKAARDPAYAIEGVHRDLRDDIPVRLAESLQSWFRDVDFSCDLEVLSLYHAALITRDDKEPGAVLRQWGVARWLQDCLFRSPYFGADQEALSARLRALLPSDAIDMSAAELAEVDPLAPTRLGFRGGRGLRLPELALLAGCVEHYSLSDDPVLSPMPLSLVEALRRVAGRTLDETDDYAEACFEPTAGRNGELRWRGAHLAPPLCARWLLTNRRVSWLQHIPNDAQLETFDRFYKNPVRLAWVAFAVQAEGNALTSIVMSRAIDVWRDIATPTKAGLKPHESALMAVGLYRFLNPDDRKRASELARQADIAWRPEVLGDLAAAADAAGSADDWAAIMELLLEMVSDTSLTAQRRVDAARIALNRSSMTKLPQRDGVRIQLARLSRAQPFAASASLVRELRRLGVLGHPHDGGHI